MTPPVPAPDVPPHVHRTTASSPMLPTTRAKEALRANPRRKRTAAFRSRGTRVRKQSRPPRHPTSAGEACAVLINFVDEMRAREDRARELYYEERDAHHFTSHKDDTDTSTSAYSDPWQDDDCGGSEVDSVANPSNDSAGSLEDFIDDDESSLADSHSEYTPSCASRSDSRSISRASTSSSRSAHSAGLALARHATKDCPCIHCTRRRPGMN